MVLGVPLTLGRFSVRLKTRSRVPEKMKVKFFEKDRSGRVDSNHRPPGPEPDSAAFRSFQRIFYFQSINDQSLFGSLLKPVAPSGKLVLSQLQNYLLKHRVNPSAETNFGCYTCRTAKSALFMFSTDSLMTLCPNCHRNGRYLRTNPECGSPRSEPLQ
jgi:hypothetical protein